VVGTIAYFFDSIKAQNRSLTFTSGQAFSDQKDYELVLGANVAKQYQHRIADRITLSHGTGKGPAQDHADSPFVITGILAATGTPIDNSVFISIQSFNNLHDGSKNLQFAQLDSAQYTAFLIGLQQRSAVFSVRRQIDALKSFSLMAIMPGVALDELWQTMEIAENALILVSLGVVLTSIFGIITALMVSLEARGREIATLRAIGARPSQIFFLIIWETFMISLSGIIFGWALLQATLLIFSDWFMKEWGILIQSGLPSQNDVLAILSILAIALLCSTLPAIKAYRLALHEGLNPPSI
jgi:putative ABC transport system permease protein